MGELINLNSPKAITDADIPAAIARDAEYIAADTAHAAAVDPHPIYLTQTEGDGRYRQSANGIFVDNVTRIVSYSGGSIAAADGPGTPPPDIGLQVVAKNAVSAAFLAFHRPEIFAFYFGLDVDNQLKVGGWSLGNNSYKIWHEGIFPAPTTRTKVITGLTSPSTNDGSVNILHGLNFNKILSVVGRIETTVGQFVFSDSLMPNAQFYAWIATTDIVIKNVAGASSLLLSKPLALIIVHTL